MASPSEVAHLVVDLVESRAASLGTGRLVCVDGPAGSGKTTLAASIAALRPGTLVVNTDDLLTGWRGLPTLPLAVDALLRPLASGRPGSYRRYDWHAGAAAGTVTVSPTPLLVLEGCGSGARAYADLATALVWVSAPAEACLARGVERDGPAVAAHWQQWTLDEDEHFRLEGTRARADVLVDGTGTTPAVVRAPGSPTGP